MNKYTQTVQLESGVTVTVRAWTLAEMGAASGEFLTLIDALNAPLTQGKPAIGIDVPLLLHRAIRNSLLRPEEVDSLRASDIPAVLDAIYSVNGLKELIKKSLRFRLEMQQAQKEALASLP